MAETHKDARRVREVGGPLSVQIGENEDLGALGGAFSIESQPGGDPIDGQGAVERGRQR